ncbi:hypothetical protein B5X24_HaOG214368 [Helicoverpa armigera]|nr:hypothetical protein B5X24_HaOG214368 [Helicoverpa armigera]
MRKTSRIERSGRRIYGKWIPSEDGINAKKKKKNQDINTMDALSTGSLSGAQKEELMDQVKQQIAIANAQELLTKMSEKCFKKCINKPGTALDNSEQKCIAMCMDRYMDAWNLVSRTYSSRIQRERNNM